VCSHPELIIKLSKRLNLITVLFLIFLLWFLSCSHKHLLIILIKLKFRYKGKATRQQTFKDMEWFHICLLYFGFMLLFIWFLCVLSRVFSCLLKKIHEVFPSVIFRGK
jgi:hypothetical protein